MNRRAAIAALVAVLATSTWASYALGASDPGGLSVSPPLINKPLSSNELTPAEVTVTNHNRNAELITVSSAPFKALDESGRASISISAPEIQNINNNVEWIDLSENQFQLQPGESHVVHFSMVASRASTGGNYAALLFRPVLKTPSGKTAFEPVASVLVLATKLGQVRYDLKVSSLTGASSGFHLPRQVTVRFRNNGNVHVVPRGIVTVSGPSGKVVAKGTLNDGSGFILPSSYRRFPVDLQTVRSSLWPAMYTVTVQYRYDGTNEIQVYSQQFLYINPLGLAVILLLAIVSMAALWLARRAALNPR